MSTSRPSGSGYQTRPASGHDEGSDHGRQLIADRFAAGPAIVVRSSIRRSCSAVLCFGTGTSQDHHTLGIKSRTIKIPASHRIAAKLDATPFQIPLAWLPHRSPTTLLIPGTSSLGPHPRDLIAGTSSPGPHPRDLIPGTSSLAHLRENIAGAGIGLPTDVLEELTTIGE
jgi:hypothetical protein